MSETEGFVRRGAVTGRVHRIGVVLAGLALLMAAGHAITEICWWATLAAAIMRQVSSA